MYKIPYNRAAAANYARRWALGRNSAYYDFSRLGGDCTNFASQCIYAGSMVMNFTRVLGWYYLSLSDRSPAWSGVEYLYNFLVGNKSVGPYGYEVAWDEAQIGDIVQLGRQNGDFYHSPVITALKPVMLVAAHSDDALDRPLSSYNYEKARFIHIDAVRTW
ncbi:MAG: amidase domain-containing protein [Clostridia bacterium]|nr:amidase domain-containing protein [Clostridia bacterium]